MPVHQISVVPAKETASNGRNSGKSKDRNKDENDKVPRRSGSRTSNISKASSSTTGIGPTASPAPLSPPLLRISAGSATARATRTAPDHAVPLHGSLRFVHPDCLHQWIKSSDTRCCELCKYDFIMETQLKPLRKWEKLQMSTRERRQIFCSVSFHIIAVICVVWSLYVLIDRTAEEIKQGRENGVLEWPFWTKLIVVAIGFTGGLIFMYIQCKVYLQLWRRLKAYNRIIFVQNCPDTVKKGEEKMLPASQANGKHDSVEVPVPQTETNSHRPVGRHRSRRSARLTAYSGSLVKYPSSPHHSHFISET